MVKKQQIGLVLVKDTGKVKRKGQREGGRKWDWQKRWRGRTERGVGRRSEILRDGKSGREKQPNLFCLCGSVELSPLWNNFHYLSLLTQVFFISSFPSSSSLNFFFLFFCTYSPHFFLFFRWPLC